MQETPNLIVNIIPAVMMMPITFITAWTIMYLLFFRNKKKKETEPTTGKSKGYSDCTLNKIMGYDFIQIKEIERKDAKAPVTREEAKPVITFAESKGTGVTEIMNTESKDEEYDDVTDEEIYRVDENDVPDTTDEEGDKEAYEDEDRVDISMQDEYSNDMVRDLESEEDWPESSIPPDQKDSYANWLYSGIDENGTSFQEEQQHLSESSPEEQQLFYEDREKISNIMEQLQSMHDSNYMTPEQEEAFNNINMIGIKKPE